MNLTFAPNLLDDADQFRAQQRDHSQALVQLLEDLLAGRKVLKVYSQMKSYGDSSANPYLLQGDEAAAA